jgi:hypothetical protein
VFILLQQLRQLGDVGGDAPGLVAGEHLVDDRAARALSSRFDTMNYRRETVSAGGLLSFTGT